MGIFPICKVGPVIFCGSWRLIIVHIIHTILAVTLKLFNTSSGPTFMPDFFEPMGPIDSSIVWMMQNFECANHISGQANQPIWSLTLDHMTQGCQINSRYKRSTVQEPQLRMKAHCIKCIKQVPLFLIISPTKCHAFIEDGVTYLVP
jgi:hypothetical protein